MSVRLRCQNDLIQVNSAQPVLVSSSESRAGNRAGRAGLGRSNSEPGKNRVGPKLAQFFQAKILTAQPALKTGPVGPNSLLKAKKNSGGPGRAMPYRAGPYWVGQI